MPENFRDPGFCNPMVVRIAEFLTQIGIGVRAVDLPSETILPGIAVEQGGLLVDEARLTWPGDLLHEAGHLAVISPEERSRASADTGDSGGLEMAAIAWSYAAAIHIGLEPAIVFHEGGYRGGSRAILENFGAGRFFGTPLLELWQMTAGPKRASELGVEPYPNMLLWVRP